jgi:hypothetical protein
MPTSKLLSRSACRRRDEHDGADLHESWRIATICAEGLLKRSLLPVSIVLTLVGSALGELLLLRIPLRLLQLTIAIAMIAVAIFSLAKEDSGTSAHSVSSSRRAVGYVATFLLAVYGGFFSGGYITMLTTVFVLLFGLTLLQSVATTKAVNVFSSAIATLIFAWHGVRRLQARYHSRVDDVLGCHHWRTRHNAAQPHLASAHLSSGRLGACGEDGLRISTAATAVTLAGVLFLLQ